MLKKYATVMALVLVVYGCGGGAHPARCSSVSVAVSVETRIANSAYFGTTGLRDGWIRGTSDQ